MKVSPEAPFTIIYSLYQLEDLGYIFQSYIIQLDNLGNPSLLYQNISSKNAKEFSSQLDETDFEIINLVDSSQRESILKKFNTKKQSITDFFIRLSDPDKGDKATRESISEYLEEKNTKILEKATTKDIYISGKDGYPAWRKVDRKPKEATAVFHLFKNADNTHYFPSIRYEGERVDYQYKQAILISEQPAWLLINATLYHFDKHFDGKKLKPFFEKKFIPIPRKIEEEYFRKFVLPLLAQHQVLAKGYTIKTNTYPASTKLVISNSTENNEDSLFIQLRYTYNEQQYAPENFHAPWYASLEKESNGYAFSRIKRDLEYEKAIYHKLKDWGFDFNQDKAFISKAFFADWLLNNQETLEELQISLESNPESTEQYFLGNSSFNINIEENESADWFDINVLVRFGPYEIPFIQLRKYILQGKSEFKLPNGEIAIIPPVWFTDYADLLEKLTINADNQASLAKHHVPLVLQLEKDCLASVIIGRKLQKLREFETIKEYPVPQGFLGTLRPYQQAGYYWLSFLNDYNFGGCLADDMGLGKTIQTLVLLQAQKEAGITSPSLIILPVSLIYNWTTEAQKFTPDLKIYHHIGGNRPKSEEAFNNADLIITSYGIVRLDIDLLKTLRFNYVILDESQAIKNPNSLTTQAVMQLHSAHRLILTGTPLENSTLDLWSQMSFVNPGLLGSHRYFKNAYLNPIEKNGDEATLKKLLSTIKPFILRRLKSQVAKDLPEKIESIEYSAMTDEQEEYYEQIKSQYRNQILEQIEVEGINKTQFLLLQGLGQLRQIANHPKMVDEEYDFNSGKFNDVFHKLDTILKENHKVLIFSSFVKQLKLFKEEFDKRNLKYAYLDGQTTHRMEEVDRFQNDSSIQIFLISIKAGGVGLNLTAAEYVFILDPWWNPAVEAQAIDRAHRIGQDKTVFIYRFITKNTVEEKIVALQNKKRMLANELIGSEDGFIKSLTKEDILQILD